MAKIESIQILTVKRNASRGGTIYSDTWNDTIEEILHDFNELSDQWNNNLTPLTSSLADGTNDIDAFTDGLSGKTIYSSPDATSTSEVLYWNSSNTRPKTMFEQFADIYNTINNVKDTLEGQISIQIPTATQVGIADNGDLFTSSNVEDALAEIKSELDIISVSASGVEVKEEGSSVGTGFTTINFVGSGVTATDAGGNESTITISTGSGDVAKVGTPVDNQIGVWTGDGTLEGDTNFTWDGSSLAITGSATIGGQAVVVTNDSRLTDARTPTSHASSHEDGGSDELTVQNLGSGAAVANKILESDGAGGWNLIDTPSGGSGSGDVTKVGTPVNNQIGVWTGDGTIEGNNNLTWSGSTLSLESTIDTILGIKSTSSSSESIVRFLNSSGAYEGEIGYIGAIDKFIISEGSTNQSYMEFTNGQIKIQVGSINSIPPQFTIDGIANNRDAVMGYSINDSIKWLTGVADNLANDPFIISKGIGWSSAVADPVLLLDGSTGAATFGNDVTVEGDHYVSGSNAGDNGINFGIKTKVVLVDLNGSDTVSVFTFSNETAIMGVTAYVTIPITTDITNNLVHFGFNHGGNTFGSISDFTVGATLSTQAALEAYTYLPFYIDSINYGNTLYISTDGAAEFTGGQVRVAIYYMEFSIPTS